MSTSSRLRFICIAIVLSWASSVWATNLVNGVPGFSDESLVPVPVIVPIGMQIVPFRGELHSTIVAQPAGGQRRVITDISFHNLIVENFILPPEAGYFSLHVHMAQCFSGGFIDELVHGTDEFPGGLNNFTINTAADFSLTSGGVANQPVDKQVNERNYYSFAWMEGIDGFCGPANMLNAYNCALGSPLYPQGRPADLTMTPKNIRSAELPQYFSRPDARDADGLASAPGKKIALLFVGDDRSPGLSQGTLRRRRHYRDAFKMRNILINRYGYAPADIRVYYHDGTLPPGVGLANIINGAGSVPNFNSFFTTPPQAIGPDDGIFIWTSNHGGKWTRFTGQVLMVPNPMGGGVAEINFSADPIFLSAVNGKNALRRLGLPYFELEKVVNPGNDPINVFLNGSLLGTISSPGDQLEFDPSLLTSANDIRFEASSPSVAIGDFGLHVHTANDAIVPCDVDDNGVIDRNDIALVFAARDTTAAIDDPRDENQDGVITVNDARRCVLQCTKAGCAP